MDILVGRIIIAGIVGYLLGLSVKRKTTARLFSIVCMGAALVTVISIGFFHPLSVSWSADPGRLSAQVVAAMGFVGTGLIWISNERQIRGIAPAAALWLTAIIGIAIGAGIKYVGLGIVLVLILVYAVLRKIPRRSGQGKR